MGILAVDVSKAEHVVFDGKCRLNVENEHCAISKLLASHPGFEVICEATSKYHLSLARLAYEAGHRVYVVNPKEARNYKESRSFRAKTDPLDAKYLYEFALKHSGELRSWRPMAPDLQLIRDLLGKRDQAVKSRTKLTQAFDGDARLDHCLSTLGELIHSLDKEIEELAQSQDEYHRMKSLPGVGPLAAAALTCVLCRHDFKSAAALVAFFGIDLRVRDSGKFKGKRTLSKRGDPLLRFLICCAGKSLLLSKHGQAKALNLKAKGRHAPERWVIAARKLVRAAFALHNSQSTFEPTKWSWQT